MAQVISETKTIVAVLGFLAAIVMTVWLIINIPLIDYKRILTEEHELDSLQDGDDTNEGSTEHLKMD